MGSANPDWDALWERHEREEHLELGWGQETPRPDGTVWVSGRHIRDAALGCLLLARGPLGIDDILDWLSREGVRVGGSAAPRKALSDALRYQRSIGRVTPVARGRYEATAVPPSVAKRARRRLRYRSWPWAVRDPEGSLPAR